MRNTGTQNPHGARMQLRLRPALIYILLVAAVSILWLFSPRPVRAADFCGRYVSINEHMGFVVNCDAGTYALPAEIPARLLRKDEIRQSRPLYVLLGTVVGYPLSRLARLVAPGLDPRAPFHVGFAMLNLIILYLSVLLFDALLTGSGVDALVTMPLALFLVANDVTKAFVWTAHQQMFSLFTPLAALFLFQKIAGARALSRVKLWSLSLALGILPLVYGNFLVVLPTLLLADALASRRSGTLGAGGVVSRCGPAAVVFVVPTLIWVGLVTWSAGSYYNHEMVVYRQLIWLADAARTGLDGFMGQVARNTRTYAATFLSLEMLPFGGTCLLLMLGRTVVGRSTWPGPEAGPSSARSIHRIGCMVVAGCFFFFLWGLGYYQTRLTFSLVPPALCLAGIELARLSGTDRIAIRRLAWVLTPLACLWTALHVIKYGPFS
jgi:hypothetical protein